MEPHEWYDRIASFYRDSSGDKRRRQLAADLLELRPGHVVLAPGVGTGFDLPYLVPAVGAKGHVIGLDYSKEMLSRAESLVNDRRWTNVRLIHADARVLSADLLYEHARIRQVDALLFANVLSIVPEWRDVFERGFRILRPGGRCVIIDIKPLAGPARVLNPFVSTFWRHLGAADVGRRVETALEARAHSLTVIRSGFFIVAGATKEARQVGIATSQLDDRSPEGI
jgi:demethylmenaquinone methyltransferase/2-methoxy-6-polyprenyl-1,4-benzoquinol methylase